MGCHAKLVSQIKDIYCGHIVGSSLYLESLELFWLVSGERRFKCNYVFKFKHDVVLGAHQLRNTDGQRKFWKVVESETKHLFPGSIFNCKYSSYRAILECPKSLSDRVFIGAKFLDDLNALFLSCFKFKS